jgi:hypothetical protein
MSPPERLDGADSDDGTESERFDPEVTDLRPRAAHQRFVRLSTVGAALLLVVVVIAAILWHSGANPGPSVGTPGSTHSGGAALLSPFAPLDRGGGTTCVADAAWSSDSRYYAVLGYQGICPADSYVPGVVDIFDVQTNQLHDWFLPDGLILGSLRGGTLGALPTPVPAGLQATPTPNPNQYTPEIAYRHILWSPDGRLALTFSVYPAPLARALPTDSRFDGILIRQREGVGTSLNIVSTTVNAAFPGYWLVGNNSPPIPMAPVYHWTTEGTLAAGEASALPPGAIGNPEGDTVFTIWQPGILIRATRGTADSHDAYVWATAFAAWSPDGNVVAESSNLTARLQPASAPPPDTQTIAAFGLAQAPLLPVRDAALAAVLAAVAARPLDTGGVQFNPYTTALAWRPDGRMLAAYSEGSFGVTSVALDLYDTGDGKKLASLVPLSSDSATLSTGTVLRWSPDGKWLLLVSGPLGSVTLWGANALPH